ncbi:hypothetical protein LguiB_033829 [Lonicera macranthoides]
MRPPGLVPVRWASETCKGVRSESPVRFTRKRTKRGRVRGKATDKPSLHVCLRNQDSIGFGNYITVWEVFVNETFCKNPKLPKTVDFFFSGLHNTGNTSNPVEPIVTPANVVQIPGLNTLGISLICIDYAPNGLNPHHTHPMLVRPFLSWRFNVGKTNAVAITVLSSQNQGIITIANAVFGSNLPISSDVLPKAFQVDKNVIDHLQEQLWWDNN